MKLKDKRITLYKIVQEGGYSADKWVPMGTVWAYYRQLSGKEYFAAMAAQQSEECVFIINWTKDVDTRMGIGYKGKYYDITRVDDYEGYKNDIQLYAKYNSSLGPLTQQ